METHSECSGDGSLGGDVPLMRSLGGNVVGVEVVTAVRRHIL